MIHGIHHTALSTRDLDRLVKFYCDAFQMSVEFVFPWDETNQAFRETHGVGDTKGRVAMISNGASRLELFEYAKPAPRADHAPRMNADLGIAHFCVQVSDIAKEVLRLRGLGMTFLSGIVDQTPTISMCYGRDPDGNLIELIEYR